MKLRRICSTAKPASPSAGSALAPSPPPTICRSGVVPAGRRDGRLHVGPIGVSITDHVQDAVRGDQVDHRPPRLRIGHAASDWTGLASPWTRAAVTASVWTQQQQRPAQPSTGQVTGSKDLERACPSLRVGCRGGPRRRAENGDAEVARAQWSRVKWPKDVSLGQ